MPTKNTRSKKWQDNEVFVDTENSFANALEMLALKWSKNTEVFEHIKKSFEEILKSKRINNVETDVVKLRKKDALLKSTWRTSHDRIESGSGKAAMQYPAWYHVINPVGSGTHAEVELSESSSEMLLRITPLNDESECDSESESDAETHENTKEIEADYRNK